MTSRPKCRRILIIEPNRNLRNALGHLLTERGFEVTYARDEKTAMETLMAGELPNVILLELELQSGSGWRFLAAQKTVKSLRKIPTLVFSSRSREPEIDLLESLERLCDGNSAGESIDKPDDDRSPALHLPKQLAFFKSTLPKSGKNPTNPTNPT